MNQTKKRLTIINLAISITDIEAIQLQVLKLGLLKTDDKIREILSMLNEQNYAQAQRLISEYIKAPNGTVLQRTSQEENFNTDSEEITHNTPETLNEDQDIIEEFNLFTESTQEPENEAVNYDSFLDLAIKPKKLSSESINYDTLLNVAADEILPENIALDITQKSKETFFEETSSIIQNADDFFDNTHPIEEETHENPIENFSSKESTLDTMIDKKTVDDDIPETVTTPEIQTEEESLELHYKPIPYIDQKFNHLCTQYPPIELTKNRYFSVENWLLQISTEGYTETEIETRIQEVNTLAHTNISEAGQLLLATASTESKYAQFIMARALYTGDILQKNISEAVEIIKQLAINDDYAEAICDLGQFYENGLVVDKDKEKAKLLYKKAIDLGIQRAVKHYDRVHKKNNGLFSFLKK